MRAANYSNGILCLIVIGMFCGLRLLSVPPYWALPTVIATLFSFGAFAGWYRDRHLHLPIFGIRGGGLFGLMLSGIWDELCLSGFLSILWPAAFYRIMRHRPRGQSTLWARLFAETDLPAIVFLVCHFATAWSTAEALYIAFGTWCFQYLVTTSIPARRAHIGAHS